MPDNTEPLGCLVWFVPIAISAVMTIFLLFQGVSRITIYLPGLALILIGIVWALEIERK